LAVLKPCRKGGKWGEGVLIKGGVQQNSCKSIKIPYPKCCCLEQCFNKLWSCPRRQACQKPHAGPQHCAGGGSGTLPTAWASRLETFSRGTLSFRLSSAMYWAEKSWFS